MASKQMFALILAIVSAVAPFAMSGDIVVGGKEGWRPGFNYTEWAAAQKFWVGDNLGNFYINQNRIVVCLVVIKCL